MNRHPALVRTPLRPSVRPRDALVRGAPRRGGLAGPSEATSGRRASASAPGERLPAEGARPGGRLGLILAAVALALAGCAPETAIRRSAAIPGAHLPVRAGAALDEGQVRLAAHANAIRATRATYASLFPEEGDPGVLVPTLELGLSGYAGVLPELEIGAQVLYAHHRWLRPNTVGVLPFPTGREQGVLLGGVGLRYNAPIDHPALRVGVVGELNVAAIQQAVYVFDASVDGYRFERLDDDLFALPNVAVQVAWEVAPEAAWRLSPYLILGAQRGVTNVGFDANLANLDDSTLEGFIIGYVGLGADLEVGALIVGAAFYFPFHGVALIDFGPSFALTLGATLD